MRLRRSSWHKAWMPCSGSPMCVVAAFTPYRSGVGNITGRRSRVGSQLGRSARAVEGGVGGADVLVEAAVDVELVAEGGARPPQAVGVADAGGAGEFPLDALHLGLHQAARSAHQNPPVGHHY